MLDVWHVSDLISDVNDFMELLNVNNHHNHPSEAVSDAAAGSSEGVTEKAETDVIVIELDSKDKAALMDRYTKSLGVSETDNKAKLSKEIQASLKVGG